ncbi:hypothetical protein ACTI_57350 [Actinoplanes sp. OR16]|nr:hypothetical protein ACTI_57350 [Actinoplanes sp. OR16]
MLISIQAVSVVEKAAEAAPAEDAAIEAAPAEGAGIAGAPTEDAATDGDAEGRVAGCAGSEQAVRPDVRTTVRAATTMARPAVGNGGSFGGTGAVSGSGTGRVNGFY